MADWTSKEFKQRRSLNLAVSRMMCVFTGLPLWFVEERVKATKHFEFVDLSIGDEDMERLNR